MAQSIPICSQDEAFHLLHQLILVLDADPLIDEVGYIHPSQLSMLKEEESASDLSSKSLVSNEKLSSMSSQAVPLGSNNAFFWSKEHNLGFSTAYLLPLYKAAKNKFMDSYMSYKMKSSFPEKNENVQLSITEIENNLMKYSRALLLLSSDFGTAWNARKLVISKREDFSVSEELNVSTLVLSLAPKSENAWSYRRWIISRIAGRCATLESLLEKESKIAEKYAEILQELNTNRKWAALHVADSSCFHFRRKILLQLLSDTGPKSDMKDCPYPVESIRQLWKDELDWNELLIRRYIGREALWLHRRFLSICWLKNIVSLDRCNALQSSPNDNVSIFISKELSLLQDCISLPDSVFDDVQSQAIHAAVYFLWLTRESDIDLNEKLGAHELRTLLNKLCAEKAGVWDCLLAKHYS